MSYALDSYCITPELFELETSYIGVINVQWNAGSVRHDPRRTGRSRNDGIAAVRETHREYSHGMSDPPGDACGASDRHLYTLCRFISTKTALYRSASRACCAPNETYNQSVSTGHWLKSRPVTQQAGPVALKPDMRQM